jgi:phosphoribosyl-AMP cyclohydrolase / phosphoribosyl-ATP pyrophosphohydrolase
MLGYMNRESFEPRSPRARRCSSAAAATALAQGRDLRQRAESARDPPDCDADTLLVRAKPAGPTCHLGTTSCFGEPAPSTCSRTRGGDRVRGWPTSQDSYVAKLAAAGPARAAQKVGEEGVETALAAVTRDDDSLAGEAADLLFHLSGAVSKPCSSAWPRVSPELDGDTVRRPSSRGTAASRKQTSPAQSTRQRGRGIGR